MESNRTGEQRAIPFRTGRFFNVDSNWYFSCRETVDQGTFSSKTEAEQALVQYLEEIASPFTVAAN